MVAALVDGDESFEHRILLPFAREEESSGSRAAFAAVPVHIGGLDGWAGFLKARRWVSEGLHRFDPDVVHVHLFHAAVVVGSLRWTRKRVLTHHHGSIFVDQDRRVGQVLDRWAGRRYDRLVAVSDAVAGFLTGTYGYPAGVVEVIHNGWSGSPLPRRSSGIDFVSISHLRREKGHGVLLEAFVRVREELPGARLRLVGDGPLRQQLTRRSAELGLDDGVEFTGAVPDVWTHLAEARVAVLPSLTEPQGIAVLEAMAAGCPLIASSVGGIPEMVVHGTNGHLVPPGDPDRLAEAMLMLSGDATLRERYRDAGRRTAERWRMDQTVCRYESLYRRMAHETGRGVGRS